jgi:hypothetical protein
MHAGFRRAPAHVKGSRAKMLTYCPKNYQQRISLWPWFGILTFVHYMARMRCKTANATCIGLMLEKASLGRLNVGFLAGIHTRTEAQRWHGILLWRSGRYYIGW